MSKYSPDAAAPLDDSNDPFADDRLSNGAWGKFAESLYRILTRAPDALTVSIEAPWGSGKSFFLQRFAAYLHKKSKESTKPGLLVISLNAWESDYAHDPFVVLLRSLIKAFGADQTGQKAKRAGKKILGGLATKTVDLVVAVKSAGTIKLDSAKLLSTDTQLDKALKNLDDFETGKKELQEAIRVDLSRNDFFAVIIVDELDRCHPRFAIEFLERVKHFFGIERVKFVFGIDHEQLCNLAKGAFGPEFDAQNYLQRFFNYPTELPPPNNSPLGIELDNLIQDRLNSIYPS